MINRDEIWLVLDQYFKEDYFFTKHHLNSYNDFVTRKICGTIQALNPFVILKNNDDLKCKHEISVYIGGVTGEEVFINTPHIEIDNKSRILYPNEARLKDLTYASDIFCNITVNYTTTITHENEIRKTSHDEVFEKIKIGTIPVMLHSSLCVLQGASSSLLQELGECRYDQGGYFIIDGKEKVIVAQERIVTNRIFINKSHDLIYSLSGLIRCTSVDNPLFPKTVNIYVRSGELNIEENDDEEKEPKKGKKEKIKIPKNSIELSIPFVSKKVHLFHLFRALGIESDAEIIQMIYPNELNPIILNFLYPSVVNGSSMYTQDEVLNHLSNFVQYQSVDKVRQILITDLFPNIGSNLKQKAMFLGYITQKLINVCLGITKESDRDSYIYKRVDTSGFLIANIFRDYYNQFRRNTRNNIDREYEFGPWRNLTDIKHMLNKSNMYSTFDSKIIKDGFNKSFKGNWGVNMMEEKQDQDLIKLGLVQDLSRISYMGSISHLRRVNTPMDPTSKIVAPHRLHPSQWGIMCPCESPDGGSIGLLKNMSIMCVITYDSGIENIMTTLNNNKGFIKLADYNTCVHAPLTKILVNNNWIGIHNDPNQLKMDLKEMKQTGIIDIYTSISWNILENEISILTEAGRCCRPVFVVKEGKLIIEDYIEKIQSNKITWNELILNKAIEYIDVEESNTSLISMSSNCDLKKYTYCEIHPSTIFSILTHQIPLANHNPSPRLTFSGAQGKQAIGCYSTNFRNRIDTMAYILHYPQKCIVNTRFCEYLNLNKLPNGENLIVAIATYTGYNMEDGIIMNKTSADRGMFNLTYFKDWVGEEEVNDQENFKTVFKNPYSIIEEQLPLKNLKWGNYKNLDDNGFPKINSYITEGDAFIGKVNIETELVQDINSEMRIFGGEVKQLHYRDMSLIADKTLSGTVDKVFVFGEEDSRKCKIRFRKVRIPEFGDKCCSRSAQKGVIGMLLPQEDMPYTKDGVVPDIIINPNAIPSRMTIGHMLETLLGKIGSFEGTTIDGTPFNDNDYSGLFEDLENKYNFHKHGDEVMYNGRTGVQMETSIFIGPTYYERLKHMVSDKINYRQVNFRSVEGQLIKDARVGNITRQPTKGRGNNGGLRIGEMEKDSILSHGMNGFLKESLMERSDKYEMYIDRKTNFVAGKNPIELSKTNVPYAFKQLLHEVIGLGIYPKLFTDLDDLEEEPEDDDGVLDDGEDV